MKTATNNTKRNTMAKMFAATVIACFAMLQTTAQPKPAQTGYAKTNGVSMYYEVYGEGQPLILLHGAYMTIKMNWADLLPHLTKNRKVIAVEMQGHGHTADIDRPFSYPALANDIAGLMKHLKIDSADVFGYSFGATVGLALAIQHPQLVKKLIFASSVYRYDGWSPELRKLFETFTPEFFDNTPLKPAYEAIAPDPKHWRTFVTKMIGLDKQDYNLGEDNLKALKSPVLMIMADNDGIDLNHTATMYKLLGGGVIGDIAPMPKSHLAIIPGTSHVGLIMKTTEIASLVNNFLVPPPVQPAMFKN